MVLELVEKHTSEMDVGVTTSSSHIWQDVLDQEWLVELVSVWTISEVKSDIIRVLLPITRKSDYHRAWHIHWLSLYNNIGVS
jgi:hypothetical protein